MKTLSRLKYSTGRGLLVPLSVGLALVLCSSLAVADPPVLEGLVPDKPMILPITVQAAYNNDTMFFNIEWDADRGDTHDYVHYTNGAWQNEGAPRREAQSTIDDDPRRGPTNRTSTNYESRVTFMVMTRPDPMPSRIFPNTAVPCLVTTTAGPCPSGIHPTNGRSISMMTRKGPWTCGIIGLPAPTPSERVTINTSRRSPRAARRPAADWVTKATVPGR